MFDTTNIIIEDISNTTITSLQTEVKITDILQIENVLKPIIQQNKKKSQVFKLG